MDSVAQPDTIGHTVAKWASMVSYRSEIIARSKVWPVSVASACDFKLGSPLEIDPRHLLDSPDWSLYAIDPDRGEATFVELPEHIDLGDAPFAYTAQFEEAKSVVSLPLQVFIELSKDIQPTSTLAVLYSTGRCGSTLASRILAQIPGVWSISEPDCLTNLSLARHSVSDDLILQLFTASRRFLCQLAPEATNTIIKPRSEQVFQIEAFSRANPDVQNIFLYRDAVRYANSMFRLAQRVTGQSDFLEDPNATQLGWDFASAQAPAEEASRYLEEGQSNFDNLEAIVLAWVLRIRAAKEAFASGIPIFPLHYADLTSDRHKSTSLLLSGCGIGNKHLDIGLRGFDRDAHEGSSTANSVPTKDLNDQQRQRVIHLLHRWEQEALESGRLDFA